MASSSSSSPEMSCAPPATSQQSSVQYSDLTREEVLEDLSSRFILNLPEEELASVERVCFQVEQAHWYYEDFVREQNPHKFPSYTLKTFSEALFRACPLLHHWAQDHERAFASFMQYKTRVPVCGAIMLNATWDRCVLVKGWKSSAGWGFPKGKINEQEPRPRCAVREVLEETGYDLDGYLVPEDVIELSIKEQSISLYIVPGVPEDFPFKTRTRKEISKIAWFRLADLPTWKRSKTVPGKFYLISPFIGPLKAFINNRKPRAFGRKPRRTASVQFVQEAHLSSEEESGPGNLFSSSGGNDPNAQESSSQSSSVDNGEPQTPSPQYSAPRINHPSEHVPVNGAVGQQTLNLDGVDPHFARLLTSLSLSASIADESDKTELPSITQRPLSPPAPQAPAVAPSPNNRLPQSTPAPKDWSAHTSFDRSSDFVTQSPALSSVRPSTVVSARSPQPPSLSPNVLPHFATSHLHHKSLSASPSAAYTLPSLQPAASGAISAKPSPQISRARRGSGITADISPYLSRPRDIPKEMKYISMLENVAKESDRMSSGMDNRGSGFIQSTDPGSRSYPETSASVPPPMFGTRMESPVIYSSGPVPSSTYPSTTSRPIQPFNLQPYDDPFTVRPRTSTSLYPVPYPHTAAPTLNFHPDPPRYVGPAPVYSGYAADRMQVINPQGLHINAPLGPQHGSRVSPLHVPPLRVIPPSELSAQRYGEPPPLSAPAMSPSFSFRAPANASRPANNAHLLSILNTPAPLRMVPGVHEPSVYNGMGPTR